MGGESYHYDKVGRIEHVTTGIPNTQDFDYDAFGNLVAIDTDRQGQLDERDWPVTAKNQLLDADYDASGNLIQYQNESTALALDWDALGTVSRVSSGSIDLTYLYTAQDERVAAKLSSPFGSFVTLTLRDLDGLVLREYLDSVPDELMSDDFETGDLECWSGAVGGPPAGGGCPKIGVTWQRDHIYRNGQLVATELATAPGRIYHYLNHLGTPVLVADATGSVLQGEGDFFFPFGESQELSGHTPLSPLRYTGHLRDENGLPAIWDDLDQMHARYYGPHFGRFMRPDPIIAANLRFPQTWNQYAYAFNSPVTFLDRFGLQAGAYLDEITVTDNPIDAGWPGGIFSLLRLGSRPWGGGGSGRGIDLLYVARDFSAGFGDALLFGFGDELRERTSSDSSVDKCSDLYRRTYLTTSVATLFLGGGRLAYAGAAKGLSYAARARGTTAAVLRASTARDTLKKIFRLGINRTSRIQPANARLTEYGREGLARAIGRTNPTFNSMGALGFVDGAAALLGLEDCE